MPCARDDVTLSHSIILCMRYFWPSTVRLMEGTLLYFWIVWAQRAQIYIFLHLLHNNIVSLVQKCDTHRNCVPNSQTNKNVQLPSCLMAEYYEGLFPLFTFLGVISICISSCWSLSVACPFMIGALQYCDTPTVGSSQSSVAPKLYRIQLSAIYHCGQRLSV